MLRLNLIVFILLAISTYCQAGSFYSRKLEEDPGRSTVVLTSGKTFQLTAKEQEMNKSTFRVQVLSNIPVEDRESFIPVCVHIKKIGLLKFEARLAVKAAAQMDPANYDAFLTTLPTRISASPEDTDDVDVVVQVASEYWKNSTS